MEGGFGTLLDGGVGVAPDGGQRVARQSGAAVPAAPRCSGEGNRHGKTPVRPVRSRLRCDAGRHRAVPGANDHRRLGGVVADRIWSVGCRQGRFVRPAAGVRRRQPVPAGPYPTPDQRRPRSGDRSAGRPGGLHTGEPAATDAWLTG